MMVLLVQIELKLNSKVITPSSQIDESIPALFHPALVSPKQEPCEVWWDDIASGK